MERIRGKELPIECCHSLTTVTKAVWMRGRKEALRQLRLLKSSTLADVTTKTHTHTRTADSKARISTSMCTHFTPFPPSHWPDSPPSGAIFSLTNSQQTDRHTDREKQSEIGDDPLIGRLSSGDKQHQQQQNCLHRASGLWNGHPKFSRR